MVPELADRDDLAVTALADFTDRSLHAAAAHFTAGLSPAALAQAYLDWATHLANAPGKRMQLVDKALRKAVRFADYAGRCCASGGGTAECCIEPLPQDRRFAGEDWHRWPYNLIHQAFLLNQQWWHNATTGIRGISRQHEDLVEFMSRQILDMVSPSNFLATNPDVLRVTAATGGMNLVSGLKNLAEDWERSVSGKKPVGTENFMVGRDVAVTPGKVIYRNRLIELIQYAPATGTVRPEPVLIVPAWIMKYYILDLSPRNSLVKYLTEQGFTVFMISWKNPGRSMTLLAAQTDFTEAGELMLFINESQLAFLEDMMWEQGFLDSRQMAGTFRLLHSNDLVWSRMVHEYLMGERAPMTDLMAWNADATRMPYRMHSEYLRKLFLDNDLAEERFTVAGKPVALTDIRVPIFAVGTVSDHVAPWHSTYKINFQTDTEVTFLLTTGGHNAGIVSEPGHAGRSFQVMTRKPDDRYSGPDTFLAQAPRKAGSWWPDWVAWLAARSDAPVAPPPTGAPAAGYAPLVDSPGTYVLED
jgi:polyhydroxyalkanoate synthase